MPLDAIGPEDVAAWFDAAGLDKPGAANRALEILRAMMFRAEEWGRRERGAKPCLGIRPNPKRGIARCLDTNEPARLGRARRSRGRAVRGGPRDPAVGAHRLPPGRGAQPALARYRRRRPQPRGFENWPARAARSVRPGRVAVPALCRETRAASSDRPLAGRVFRGGDWQAAAA